jgi:hypothetical protein
LSTLSAPEPVSDGLRPENGGLSDVPALAQTQVLSERVYRAVLQMLAQGSLRVKAAGIPFVG